MAKLKTHRALGWAYFTQCGKYAAMTDFVDFNSWRGVTCKKCLRAKPKRRKRR